MHIRSLLFCLAMLMIVGLASANEGQQVAIDLSPQTALTAGKYANYFQEYTAPLSLQQAIQHFDNNPLNMSSGESLSLGITVAPVWLKVKLNNANNP